MIRGSLSLLTPSNSDFMKSLTAARKSLIRFRKLSRRSTMTRPGQECSYKQLSKGKIGEVAEDQRIKPGRFSLPISPPKWRMICERVS
jgi:hypothetical protein